MTYLSGNTPCCDEQSFVASGAVADLWSKVTQLLFRYHANVVAKRRLRQRQRAIRQMEAWQLEDIGYAEFIESQQERKIKDGQPE